MTKSAEDPVKKLGEMIKDIDFCMLTTIDNGVLRSRPMSTQNDEFNGVLWFLTSTDSHKMSEVEADNRVNVSYAEPKSNRFISVSGTASMVQDQGLIEKYWNPMHRAWFPEGKDDPRLCLLKVEVEQAEYWDASSSTLRQLVGFVKAIVTNKEADVGENEKIDL